MNIGQNIKTNQPTSLSPLNPQRNKTIIKQEKKSNPKISQVQILLWRSQLWRERRVVQNLLSTGQEVP